MRRGKALVFAAAVAFAGGTVFASRPAVGVIRWDAWGGRDGVEGGEQTRVLEQTLKPAKYRFRLPWFAQVKDDGRVILDGAAPGVMEREINFAADAGLDYFIFLDYGPKSFKSRALERFLAAENSSRLKFAVCFMLYPDGISDVDWEISIARHVKLMAHPQWLKVCGGRPLAFTFAVGNDKTSHRLRFWKLRTAAAKAGLDPYFVVFNPCPQFTWADWDKYEAEGYSAVGSYAQLGSRSNGPSTYRDFVREGEDLLQGEAVRRGKACIPGFMTGWQKDPRKDYVPYWEKGHGYHRQSGFPDLPAPNEIAVEMRRTLDFVKEHPASCPANAIAIYAWNEHDEGGWLCPTWTPSGVPDTSRLDALRTVLVSGDGNLDAQAAAMRERVLASASDYPQTGRQWYFAENGSDDNDGRSPERPLRTLAKAGTLPLKPGDAVLFRRGDLFRGFFNAQAGVTYSAWGKGPKPTLCGSLRNYADETLWVTTGVANVWRCTERIVNAGCVFFDFDPQEVGRQEVVFGKMALPGRKEPHDRPVALTEDLAFCNLFHEDALLLRSDAGNPGKRFRRIEIGSILLKHIIQVDVPGVTIDNLHFTCSGGNAVGNHPTRDFEVRNCVFNHLGGSVLLGWRFGTVRFGNAVEVWDGVDGYRVHDNWMYQIYDTGVTHQRNDTADFVCRMKNIEYARNLIERCFWSIEYYNQRNAPGSSTEDVYIHDNFCRLGGEGWGCLGRESRAMLFSFGDPPTLTRNYRMERNVFDRSLGVVCFQSGHRLEEPGSRIFSGNRYVQWEGRPFARVLGREVPMGDAAVKLVAELFGETNAVFRTVRPR